MYSVANLDERSSGPFHGVDQKSIPPKRAASFIVPFGISASYPNDGNGDNDWYEDEDKVKEAEAGCYRFEDPVVEEEI